MKFTSHLYRLSLIISEGFNEQGKSTSGRGINSSRIVLQAECAPGHCVFTLAQVGKRTIPGDVINLAIRYIGSCYTEEIDGVGDFAPNFPLPVSSEASIFQVSVPLPRRL